MTQTLYPKPIAPAPTATLQAAQPSFAIRGCTVFPALAAITALALSVRLYGLTSYGIWFDESYHVALVKLPDVPTMLDAVLSNPPSDPLYSLALRTWTG